MSGARPLFIVGMPRSGTKLLRGLIDAHPRVRLLEIETEFLPYWVRNWEAFGDLSDRESFQRFYDKSQALPFFVYLTDANNAVDMMSWYERCRSFSPAGVFEGLVRAHLKIADDDDVIWGDKSPSYLTHIPTLHRLFPDARFIHVIRDVRDYCLSIHKAWGKHMIRAAQRWTDDVASARTAGSKIDHGYCEVRYEDLLDRPAETVERVCRFLSVPFYEDMLTLSAPTENLGDTKGAREIVSSNIGKYRRAIDPKTISRIESIAAESLTAAGYPCDHAGPVVRLPPWRMRFYQLLDGINLVLFTVRERGVLSGVRFVYRYFAISGNRQSPDA